MLSLGAGATRVHLAVGATDLRKGFDGLYGLVRSRLEADPASGHLSCFATRAAPGSRRSTLTVMRHARLWDIFWAGKIPKEKRRANGARQVPIILLAIVLGIQVDLPLRYEECWQAVERPMVAGQP